MRSRKGYIQGTSLHKQGIKEKQKNSPHRFFGDNLSLQNILDPIGLFGGGGLFGGRNKGTTAGTDMAGGNPNKTGGNNNPYDNI